MALLDKVPVALNCLLAPTKLVEFAGVTAMDTNAAGVNAVEPETFPEAAVIVVEPAETAVATPFDSAELLIEAIPLFDELHVTSDVMSRIKPSE